MPKTHSLQDFLEKLAPCQWDFPDPLQVDPDGNELIILGADLAPETIVAAYMKGMFPWFSEDQAEDIAWWSPDPRCVMQTATWSPSHSLKRQMKKNQYRMSLNQDFSAVIAACGDTRRMQEGTWIGLQIQEGYTALHHLGLAHSVEVWENETLVGGLYGVMLGALFFGESMFSTRTDTSKMAFHFLMRLCQETQIPWVDCQLPNPHLLNLGAQPCTRAEYFTILYQQLAQPMPDWSIYAAHIFDGKSLLDSQPLMTHLS